MIETEMDPRCPSFFQPILPGASTQKLKIIPAMGSLLMHSLAGNATLRDRNNKLWIVGVVKNGKAWYFEKGWETFYKDNSIETGDFLVFEYKGHNLFDFKLFGETACEKKGFRVEEDEPAMEGEDSLEDGNEKLTGEITFGANDLPSKRRYIKKNVPNCYNDEIFRSGLALRPENPYFITRLRPSRRSQLYIPNEVVMDYDLKLPEVTSLVDEDGMRWETKIKQWKDGRLVCYGGWRSLCNVNGIEKGDICICEFLQEKGHKGMSIKVRVVRK